jgi:hypothetical protein
VLDHEFSIVHFCNELRHLWSLILPNRPGGDTIANRKKPMFIRTNSLILLILFFVHAGWSQEDSLHRRTESTLTIITSDAVVLVPSAIMVLLNHELGHYTVASLFGAHNARFGIVRSKPEGGHQLGWTDWDNKIGSAGTAFAALGGVVFSRGLAEGSDCLLKNVTLPTWMQRFFSITFILGRFDFSRYVLNDALVSLFGHRGSDIDIFVSEVAGQDGGGNVFLYAALLGIAAVDLILDWDRIALHWGIITGAPYQPTTVAAAQLRVSPSITARGFGMQLGFTW